MVVEDQSRLVAPQRYGVVDSELHQALDDLVVLAAHVCRVPSALISFLDGERQWIASTAGCEIRELPRATSLFQYAADEPDDVLVVPDATGDPRFKNNPFVTGAPGIRFYAAAPLTTPCGSLIGSLCVFDYAPRELNNAENRALRTVADQVISQLELRRVQREHEQSIEQTSASLSRLAVLERLTERSPVFAMRWRATPDWQVEFLSGNVSQFGYTPAEILSNEVTLAHVVHPDDLRRILRDREALAANRENGPRVIRREYRILTKDRHTRWVRDLTWMVEEPEGVRFECIVVDVTDEHLRAEHIRLLEEALRTANVGVFVADAAEPGCPVVYMNPAVERITGFTEQEVVHQPCRFAVVEDAVQTDLKRLQDAMRDGTECEVVLRSRHKNGGSFWNELHLAPVRNASGELTHFIGIQTDVTDRQEAADELRRRDAVMEAVAFAAEHLVLDLDPIAALPSVLDRIRWATGVECACVWKCNLDGARPVSLSLLKHSTSPLHESPNPTGLRSVPWTCEAGDEDAGPGQNCVSKGKHGDRSSASPRELRLLHALEIDSFFFVPIPTASGEPWGLLTLGSSRPGMKWGALVLDAMRSAARVLSAVIEMRATADALFRSKTKYRTLVANLHDVVFRTDTEGNLVFLSKAWTDITGFAVEDNLHHLVETMVIDEDRLLHRKHFDALLTLKRESSHYEVRFQTRSGEVRWIEIRARASRGSDGAVTGMDGTFTDITARRAAEDSQRLLMTAIEASVDGVGVLDRDNRFSYVNQAMCEIWGRSGAKDYLSKALCEILPPERMHVFKNEIAPALEHRGWFRGTFKRMGNDGSSRLIEVTMTRVAGGGTSILCRDTTQRVASENRIRAALAEKNLMLKEVHHRVKNNLQIISSLLNMQLDDVGDSSLHVPLMEAQNRVMSMALVYEMLHETNGITAIKMPTYLSCLADNLLGANREAECDIRVHVESENLEVGIDTAIPCGMIVTELLGSAVMHAFPRGGQGIIVVRANRKTDGRIQVVVSDNGLGFPTGFDPMSSDHLGMRLVQMLVRQLHGTFGTRHGDCACFEIELQEVNHSTLAAA